MKNKICGECGKPIIEDVRSNRKFHPECFKIRRRRMQLENHRRYYPKKEYPPKYCPDCLAEGKSKEDSLLPKNKWNKTNCVRCEWHQFKHFKELQKISTIKDVDGSTIKARYNRPSREYIVLAECIFCHELFETHHKNTRYCIKHRDGKNRNLYQVGKKILTDEERKKQVKDYQKKLENENKLEKIGTYDTATKIHYTNPINKMRTDKEGKPDFDKELEDIKYIKAKTYSKKKDKKMYNPAEGDYVRNLVKEFKEE